MKNLKKIRQKKKMTREELAIKTDNSYATIRAYERGIRMASVERAQRIADVLDVTIEELVK